MKHKLFWMSIVAIALAMPIALAKTADPQQAANALNVNNFIKDERATAPPVIQGRAYHQQAQPSVAAENAKNIALAKVGGGAVARVETKYPKHGMEYKVVIVRGDYNYNVNVSAYDGAVRNYKMGQITKVGADAYYNAAGAIDAEKAKSIAIQNSGGGIVTKCKLDYKRREGLMIYKIHVQNGQYEYRVELAAATGAVYKVEPRYKKP